MKLERARQALHRAGRYLIPRFAFCMFALLAGLWATHVRRSGTDAKDWVLYHDTATLLLSGRIAEIYPGVTPGFPFFYPPYFLWQVLPLGFVPHTAGYAFVVCAMLLASGAALWTLRAALDDRRGPWDDWLWVVVSSAGFTWMLVVGHISGWYLLLLSLALLAWRRGQPFVAGLVLSLVFTKPHYGLPVLALVALAGGWRVVAGAVTGGALLALSTLPLGWPIWKAWLSVASQATSTVAAAPAWKQITLRATWIGLLGPARSSLSTALWLATAVPLLVLAAAACWRVRAVPGKEGRILGLGVLASIACSPYAFHYDGLLLALPGLVWYFRPSSYFAPGMRRACGVAIALAYGVQHLDGWILRRGVPLTGVVVAAWLAAEALDLLRGRDERPGATLTPAGGPG